MGQNAATALGRLAAPHLLLMLPAGMLGAVAIWIVWHLAFPTPVTLPAACSVPAILAHRTNSVLAAGAAARQGFCGVEVDVHWRDGYGAIVSHDELPPAWTQANSLSLSGLTDSLAEAPALLWVDFKNLSRGNAREAAAYLEALVAKHGLHHRMIVESRSPLALWEVSRRVPTVIPAYWIPARPTGARATLYDVKLAVALGVLGFPAISVPQQHLTPQFAERFDRFALFTWTCNTPDQVNVATRRGARIILTDMDSPAASLARTADSTR